ncbi:hypothetical protein Taro_021665 [Colocasia esculenta]|uniref:Uncharacterized protein n=1 Tax=Colocasia esculenta TaxID=4460 RepID=A0A843US39_COLES|nr:hypothetical protein [Colocasia esculenta]
MMVVSTQCFKYKSKRSSSVDTSSGGVDTRDNYQNTFWLIWDNVSTLVQVVSTLATFQNTFWTKLQWLEEYDVQVYLSRMRNQRG